MSISKNPRTRNNRVLATLPKAGLPGTLFCLVLKPLSENVQNRAIHISPVAKVRPEPSEALYRVPRQASKRGFLGICGAWPGPGAEFHVKIIVWPGVGAELFVNVSVWPGQGAEFFVKMSVWPGLGRFARKNDWGF